MFRPTDRSLRPRLVAVAVVTALSACIVGTALSAPTAARVLVVDASFAIRSPDPNVSGQATAKLIARVRFDTLLTYKAGITPSPQPDIASRYTVNKTATKFTFYLRKNVRFADGTPLTSADVVFSLRRAIYLKQDASQILADVTISAPSKYVVVIKTKAPNPALPLTVANPQLAIFNSALAKEHGALDTPNAATDDKASAWFSSPASQGVGSGPYTLADYNPASQITLGRNKKWWQGKPRWDSIVLRNMVPAAQGLSVQRGTHEVALDLSAVDIGTLKGAPVNIATTASPSVFLIGLNQDNAVSPITANPKFDEAVRKAIDYKALVTLAGPGGQQVGGLIPPSVPAALPAAQGLKRNLAAARSAYAASGVKEPITLEYPSDRAPAGLSFASVAQKIQANLQEAGIKVNLQGEPVATFVGRETAGRVAFGLFVNVPGTFDGVELARFTPGGGLAVLWGSPTGSNPKLEAAVKKAMSTTADAARIEAWRAVQKLQLSSGPFIPLLVPTQVVVSTKDLKDVVFNPIWNINLNAIRPA
jgi:peptide/nickel transport system substrate-binding protein